MHCLDYQAQKKYTLNLPYSLLFIFNYKRKALDEVAAYFLAGVVFGSTEAPFIEGAEGVVIQSAVAAGAHYFGAFYAPIDAYNATHDNAPADSRITQRLRIN